PPPPTTFARRSANLRASIILTSTPATRPRKKSSRLFPRPTTFSAIPRSGRFTTSLGSTPTISIRLRRRLMRAAVDSLEPVPATLAEAFLEAGTEPGSDLEYQVNVPFWTAIRGGVMKLNIARRDVCGNCRGNGFLEAPG